MERRSKGAKGAQWRCERGERGNAKEDTKEVVKRNAKGDQKEVAKWTDNSKTHNNQSEHSTSMPSVCKSIVLMDLVIKTIVSNPFTSPYPTSFSVPLFHILIRNLFGIIFFLF